MALPFLPEEQIRSTYLSLELPLLGLLDSEKELVKIFRSYFNRTWINGNVNLSVFYFEKATNNGAESYHKCLKSYFETPHPNIWKFMVTLNSVITDYDLELQRLLEGHETTRGPNSKTHCKTALRNEYKDKYLNNTFSALEFLDAMTQTIGHGNLYSDATTIPVTNDFLDVSADEVEEIYCDRCNVCLLPITKISHFCMTSTSMEDFAKHVHLVCYKHKPIAQYVGLNGVLQSFNELIIVVLDLHQIYSRYPPNLIK